MDLNVAIEPTAGTIDHYWWLVGGEAWSQWCERAAPTSRGLQP